jgi:hypothetical protein
MQPPGVWGLVVPCPEPWTPGFSLGVYPWTPELGVMPCSTIIKHRVWADDGGPCCKFKWSAFWWDVQTPKREKWSCLVLQSALKFWTYQLTCNTKATPLDWELIHAYLCARKGRGYAHCIGISIKMMRSMLRGSIQKQLVIEKYKYSMQN